ncbi:protein-disulfide isomerase [Arcanobacterium pluranimalium]|uniref:DsbA family protein n=1 Tax=Arcanobacterium pluranimalium TaxID=108028 RepID=UPI00195DDE84|nr:thioredoxin domain-containing protein [Arcanobacterium pluranimalium]MBM7824622.1 protein-disulfide isomerase [Arcanobacterium pluranimalium]
MAPKQTPGMSTEKKTKEERRAEARNKARMLREQEEKRAKRNRILTIVSILVALALVVFAVVKIVTNKSSDHGSYDGEKRAVKLVNVTDDYGIYVGAKGQAVDKGNGAPTVGVYSDFICTHCNDLEKASSEAYAKHLAAGDVQVQYFPVSILGGSMSQLGAAAAFYVATYSPDNYVQFQEKLFVRTDEILKRAKPQPTAAEIADIAKAAGVPDDVLANMPASIESEEWQAVVQKATDKFREKGYKGTPTVTLDGKETEEWAKGGMPAFLDSIAKPTK